MTAYKEMLSPAVKEQTQLWSKFSIAKFQRLLNTQPRQVCSAKTRALARKYRTLKYGIRMDFPKDFGSVDYPEPSETAEATYPSL